MLKQDDPDHQPGFPLHHLHSDGDPLEQHLHPGSCLLQPNLHLSEFPTSWSSPKSLFATQVFAQWLLSNNCAPLSYLAVEQALVVITVQTHLFAYRVPQRYPMTQSQIPISQDVILSLCFAFSFLIMLFMPTSFSFRVDIYL